MTAIPGAATAQAGAGTATPGAPGQVPEAEIKQFEVPFPRGQTRDPFVAPDGRVWFVGQRGNYLAVFDPKTSAFKQYPLPDRTMPHTNIVTPDGIVWVAGNVNGTIVRFDPKNESTRIIPVPAAAGATRGTDPHTMIYDGKGGIWFTMQQSHYVGHLTIATEKIQMVATSDSVGRRTNPYGIILDPAGRPYFDLFATNKIGTIDPATMKLETFTLPEGARPRRIARTSDGGIWYTDYSRGFLGRVDPKTGKVDEYPNPSGARSLPYAMATDDADRVWYVETGVQPNRMVAFDTRTKKVVYNSVVPGEGNNSVRHMVFDPKTRQIWYGADLNFIGFVKVPPKVAS
jgi:virginiamycin B lyase